MNYGNESAGMLHAMCPEAVEALSHFNGGRKWRIDSPKRKLSNIVGKVMW